ncbi:MAG TPA: glycosyltransferase family 4 protein, partial [Castellaniella sp.]|nr:glycosyltransferase family 4 protein [Castellaniella sp.]
MPAPGMLAEDGVDLSLFSPRNLGRFQSLPHRPLVIGWAGNSKWSSERGEDFKGLYTVLMPAVHQLQQEGLNIRVELADRQQRHIPHEEMPEYYSQLDLYVCVSQMEGTPNPVLEALACGVPVISTRVGVVPQIFPNNPFGVVLPERSVAALKHRIRRYYEEGPHMIRRLSEHGLDKIRHWGWAGKADNFRRFFTQQIERPDDRRAFDV